MPYQWDYRNPEPLSQSDFVAIWNEDKQCKSIVAKTKNVYVEEAPKPKQVEYTTELLNPEGIKIGLHRLIKAHCEIISICVNEKNGHIVYKQYGNANNYPITTRLRKVPVMQDTHKSTP